LQVQDVVIGTVRFRPHEGVDLGGAAQRGAGLDLDAAIGIEGGLREDFAGQASTASRISATILLG